jgi:hypothetical protein
MREKGEGHQIDGIWCVPPEVARETFRERGLLISDSVAALERYQRQETASLIRSIKDDGAREWYSMRLMDLPVTAENIGAEMAKGDTRYVYGKHVRAKPTLKRRTELTCARRALRSTERWRIEASDDPEKVALIREAEAFLRQAAEKGRSKQLDLFSQQ